MSDVTIKKVPAAEVDAMIATLKKAGATNIKKTKDNGTFTVSFTQPDDD